MRDSALVIFLRGDVIGRRVDRGRDDGEFGGDGEWWVESGSSGAYLSVGVVIVSTVTVGGKRNSQGEVAGAGAPECWIGNREGQGLGSAGHDGRDAVDHGPLLSGVNRRAGDRGHDA